MSFECKEDPPTLWIDGSSVLPSPSSPMSERKWPVSDWGRGGGGRGDVRCKKGRGGMLLETIVWTCYDVVRFQ